MPVNEDPATIAQLNFSLEGYSDSLISDFTVWLKTADGAAETDSSWVRVGGATFLPVGADGVITASMVDYVKMDVLQYPVEQEGFRFRADDGGETSATWLAAQDTNITRGIATNTRLRMLLNNTVANADPSAYQLEYKKSSDSFYRKVVTEADYPVIEGTFIGGTGTSNTLIQPISMPAGVRPGELLLLIFSSDGAPTLSINSGGWTKLGQTSNRTITTGAIFYKFAEGNDTAVVESTNGEQNSYVIYRISGAGVPTGTVQRNLYASSDDPDIWTNDSEQADTPTHWLLRVIDLIKWIDWLILGQLISIVRMIGDSLGLLFHANP